MVSSEAHLGSTDAKETFIHGANNNNSIKSTNNNNNSNNNNSNNNNNNNIHSSSASHAPRSSWPPLEQLVAAVWDKTLGARGTTASLSESFAELGGESLLALRACAALRYELQGEVKTAVEEDAPEFGVLGGAFAPTLLLASTSLRSYCESLRAAGVGVDLDSEPNWNGNGRGDVKNGDLPTTDPSSPSSCPSSSWPSIRAAARDCTPGAAARLEALLDGVPEEHLRQQWCGMGARKGSKGNLQYTALHAAAKAGSIECVDYLLSLRARPTVAEPGSGMTALHYAAMSDSDAALKRLLEAPGAPLPVRDARGQSLLHAAARAGAAAPLKLLLRALKSSQDCPPERPPDHNENLRGDEAERQAPGNSSCNSNNNSNDDNSNSNNNLPQNQNQNQSSHNGQNNPKKLRSLRPDEGRRGLLEWTDRWARTAVHWAALNGHVEAIRLLLDSRADPAPVQISAHQMAKRTHLSQEQPLALAIRVHGADSDVANVLRTEIEKRRQIEALSVGGNTTSVAPSNGMGENTFSMGDVQFLLTLGSELGLDKLALWELKERLGAQRVQRVKCRLFFDAPEATPVQFSALKSAEKLCAVVGLHEAVTISKILQEVEGNEGGQEEGARERSLAAWISSFATWETVMAAWKHFNDSLGNSGPPPTSKSSDTSPLTFKVTCRRSGKRFANVSTQKLAVAAASSLTKKYGWRAQVRFPDFEVRVLISDSEVLIDVPILVQLSVPIGGGELVSSGLAAPVAWAMARTAELKPGDCVLDPMCGKAITLIESSLCWTKCHYLGLDIDSTQLKGASDNSRLLLEAAGRTSAAKLELMQGDARRLPLPDDSVDVILCDVPFGRQFLSVEECRNGLYDQVLAEFDRVIVKTCNGRAILLCSLEQELWLLRSAGFTVEGLPPRPEDPKIAPKSAQSWCCVCRREVKLGPLEAVLIVLHRPDSLLAKEQKHCGDGSLPPISKRLWWETSAGRGDWASLKIADRPPMQLARGREI